jgi:hypothetical protein
MVVVDGTGRIPWLDGDPRVRRRVDRPTFNEGTPSGPRPAPKPTRSARHGRSITRPNLRVRAVPRRAARVVVLGGADPRPDSGEVLGAVDPSGPRLTSPRQPSPCRGSSRHARQRPRVRAHAQRGPTGPGRSCTVGAILLACSPPSLPPAGPASPRGADPRPAGARAEPAALGEPRRRCSPRVSRARS